jgi:hypothetical protein
MAREETEVRLEIERCVDELRRGQLTEQGLLRIGEALDKGGLKRQDVLYLQAGTSSPNSPVLAMRIIEDGEISDGPDPDDWPYQTVLEAVRDGWRIVKFPDVDQVVDEKRTYGLGYEFILERYG